MATASWKKPLHAGRRFLAKNWLNFHPKVTTIGVTGSYGKTSTARAITSVLTEKFPTLQTDFNLDTVYNIPITLLKLRSKHKFLVLEMGVDHRGEMDSYLKIVKPSIGIVTGVTPVHSEPELLGSIEGIIEEKGRLLEILPKDGWAILNQDDENVKKMAKKTKAKVLWYGFEKKCDFWADKIKLDLTGTSFDLHCLDLKTGGEITLEGAKIGLIGKHFIHSALVAWGVGVIFGLNEKEMLAGLSKLRPLKGRMSLEKGPFGTTLLDDHLRANPASTISGLETLANLPHHGKKIAILGEMGELGQYSQEEHRRVGREAAKLGVDFLLGVGPLQKLTIEEAIKNGFDKNQVFWAKDVKDAAYFLKNYLKGEELIYLKGSLLRHMERIILILEDKQVDCDLVSCHRYASCQTCPKLTDVG